MFYFLDVLLTHALGTVEKKLDYLAFTQDAPEGHILDGRTSNSALRRQAVNLAIRVPSQTPASLTGVPGFGSQQLPSNADSGRQWRWLKCCVPPSHAGEPSLPLRSLCLSNVVKTLSYHLFHFHKKFKAPYLNQHLNIALRLYKIYVSVNFIPHFLTHFQSS